MDEATKDVIGMELSCKQCHGARWVNGVREMTFSQYQLASAAMFGETADPKLPTFVPISCPSCKGTGTVKVIA